jgi:hypothetical protein
LLLGTRPSVPQPQIVAEWAWPLRIRCICGAKRQWARTLLVEKFETFMSGLDAIVMPANALLTTTNLTGNPQVVVKCGFADAAPAGWLDQDQKVPRTIRISGTHLR